MPEINNISLPVTTTPSGSTVSAQQAGSHGTDGILKEEFSDLMLRASIDASAQAGNSEVKKGAVQKTLESIETSEFKVAGNILNSEQGYGLMIPNIDSSVNATDEKLLKDSLSQAASLLGYPAISITDYYPLPGNPVPSVPNQVTCNPPVSIDDDQQVDSNVTQEKLINIVGDRRFSSVDSNKPEQGQFIAQSDTNPVSQPIQSLSDMIQNQSKDSAFVNSIYTPKVFVNESADETGGKPFITNPLVKQENPVASGNDLPVVTDTGKVPIKIPYEANSPPVRSNQVFNGIEQNNTAGPRGKDQTPKVDQENKGSIRFTEEADTERTQREVQSKTFKPIDWMNDYYRRPVNEVSRGRTPLVFSPASDSSPKVDINSQNPASFRTPVNLVSKAHSEQSAQISDQKSMVPDQKTQVSANVQGTVVNSAESDDMSTVIKPEVRKSDQQTSNIQSPNLSATEKSETQPSQVNSETNQDNGDKSSYSQEFHDAFGIKVIAQDMQAQQQGNGVSSTRSIPQTQGMETSGVNISSVPSINNQSQVKVINEPIPILGEAPNRIADEIMQSTPDKLKEGQQSILKVELRPPRLGQLNIELIKTDSGLEVKLAVRTVFAKELLLQRSDEIKTALSNHGLDVRKFEIVDLNQHRQDSGNNPNGFSSGQSPFSRGGEENSSRDTGGYSGSEIAGEIESDPGNDIAVESSNSRNVDGHLNILA